PSTVSLQFKAEGMPNVQFAHDPAALVDGKPSPPSKPWINWADVGFFAEKATPNYVEIDTFRRQLRVTGITLVEDPAHPESWLRDANLEYWDAAKSEWVSAQSLLANAAVHTHRLRKPVEASRLRLVLP